MNSRERYDVKLGILQRLEESDTEEWLKERLTRKLLRYFPEDPIEVIDSFTRHGWTPSDLFHWLIHAPTFKQVNNSWAVNYEHIFLAEKIMIQAGLSRDCAHFLALTQHWVFTIPPVTLEFSVKTLVNLGYGEDVIKSIAIKMPQLFFLLPEHIVYECETATRGRYGLLWNPNLRSRGMQSQPPDDRDLLQSVIATRKNHKKNKDPGPETSEISSHETAEPRDLESTSEPLEQSVSGSAAAVINKPASKKAWRPLKLFNPLKQKTDPPEADEADRQEAVEDEKPDSGETFISLESMDAVESEEHCSVDDDGSRLHVDKIKALINAAKDDPYAWDDFTKSNPWLKQPSSPEYQACIVLLRWAPLYSVGSAGSFREDSDAGLNFRFWKKVLLGKRCREILQISPDVLERRLYVLRRIGRCPLKGPSWIMKPWESLEDAELRFRMNEIDAHGKNPKFKPYINMMLAPSREDFKRRLAYFLKSKMFQRPVYREPDDDSLIYDKDQKPPRVLTSDELKAKLLARKAK